MNEVTPTPTALTKSCCLNLVFFPNGQSVAFTAVAVTYLSWPWLTVSISPSLQVKPVGAFVTKNTQEKQLLLCRERLVHPPHTEDIIIPGVC